MSLPTVVSREEWRAARQALLVKEKALTRAYDAMNTERRELPMVEVAKQYTFQGPNGPASLRDLFGGRRQLIIYHFMFAPDWDAGCMGCSYQVDNIGDLRHLYARNTSFVLVSRAPLAKLEAYKERMGWDVPWYSSYDSDFNYDFEATTDGEVSMLSAFLRDGDVVYHTYSTTGRGTDITGSTYSLLDFTALGRQEEWEKPAGRANDEPQGWLRRHDEYTQEQLS
ncbi:hypothetical protein SE17_06175 [Kouleothrix aurantiaca]|jgi:predicted dithiol-disulfide oxidoreductase (DUF899 family)|uniref:Thioredoxin n=1 Tax=Kouleothrix aurantiaca TaxID=186479 RepID=A0A0P9DEC0_9CHLR|nr:hypothetical protein SE17_06175 [Kouleothrix aurantiaca]